MNEAETKLVAALRSGKYTQTKGRLRDNKGYCCLGVACDVLGKGEWIKDNYNNRYTYHSSPDDCSHAILPNEIQNMLDWAADNGRVQKVYKKGNPVDGSDYLTCLAEFNDAGMTFEEIADIIENGGVQHDNE